MFVIEITFEHLQWAGYCGIAVISALSLLAVAKKNIRDEFVKPIYVFVINLNFFARRRKINTLLAHAESQEEVLNEIKHQLFPNSGTSLKDQMTRMENAILNINSKQSYAMSKFRYQDEISSKYLFETDSQAQLTFANRALCELLGVSETDLLGKKWINSIVPSDRERILREWREAFDNQIPFESSQTVFDKNTDDESFEIKVYAKPDFDEDGAIIRFFGIVKVK